MTIKNHPTDEIIKSIAEVTTHADRDLLGASFANTLHKLLDVERVAVYKVHYKYNQPKYILTLEITDEMEFIHQNNQEYADIPSDANDCITNKEPLLMRASQGKFTYFQPIVNHLNKVVSLFSVSGDDPGSQPFESIMKGYFQIYLNHLKLLNESEHDTLTGLLNRRTFDRDLDRLMTEWNQISTAANGQLTNVDRRSQEDSKNNWLAVVDVDFFKRINDQYGHLYGDEVLLLLANIMRESFRDYDKLFRFGGEEFVVILCGTDHPGAASALQRFHKKIGTYPFPQVGNITVSIGYDEIANQSIPSEVLRLADDALYFGKENGRNCICYYTQLLAEGKVNAPQTAVHDDVELF